MSEVTFGAMSVNGYPYKRENGEWVPDESARARQVADEAAENKRKGELVWALRSRVCTDDEMAEIEKMGIDLLIFFHGGMATYQSGELERRMDELLLQQFKLRRAVEMEKERK